MLLNRIKYKNQQYFAFRHEFTLNEIYRFIFIMLFYAVLYITFTLIILNEILMFFFVLVLNLCHISFPSRFIFALNSLLFTLIDNEKPCQNSNWLSIIRSTVNF